MIRQPANEETPLAPAASDRPSPAADAVKPPVGELELTARVMPASNATFVGNIAGVQVVYKPIAGERPLWDFPEGTLAGREIAAFLVSEATGWNIVPTTWLGEGPHGPGMVQIWQEPSAERCEVDVVPAGQVPSGWCHVFDAVDGEDKPVSLIHEDSESLRRMAIFDALINNADRKGGHVLSMDSGHSFGVDHGVSFHTEPKLRTVLWGWAGEPLSVGERAVIENLLSALGPDNGSTSEVGLSAQLAEFISAAEIESFEQRCLDLLADGVLPLPGERWPVIPWPPF